MKKVLSYLKKAVFFSCVGLFGIFKREKLRDIGGGAVLEVWQCGRQGSGGGVAVWEEGQCWGSRVVRLCMG